MSPQKMKTDDPRFPLGFVKLDRRYLDWRWLPDENVCQVYLYLLLRANFQEKAVFEYIIHVGELLTSYSTISEHLRKSPQHIKRIIAKLKKTGEVDTKRIGNGLLIKLIKYNDFNALKQDELSSSDLRATDLQQTGELLAIINKKEKNAQNVYNEKETPSGLAMNWSAFKQHPQSNGPVPLGNILGLRNEGPSVDEIEDYYHQMHFQRVDIYKFHAYYSRRNWCDKFGNPIKDWKHSLDQWEMFGEEYAREG